MPSSRRLALVLAPLVAVVGCGDGPKKPPLFQPKPECEGAKVVPLAGDWQMVIHELEIAKASEGLDLDGDGRPDNKLAAVGNLAGPAIQEALDKGDIVIPIELFDFPAVAADDCVKFGVYIGDHLEVEEGDPPQIVLDPLSFKTDGSPVIEFNSGSTRQDGATVRLDAGPSIFAVTVPVTDGIDLELRITGATIEAEVAMVTGGVVIQNAILGGVLDANTLDKIRGLDVEQIDLKPEDSLLDAIFGNVLGVLLGLQKTKVKIDGSEIDCLTPDIDVDQDGLEAFCDTTGDGKVDLCVDGDGTKVYDKPGEECSEARDAEGNLRFVDGISVALKFSTIPAVLTDTID
jgi:hypothetical protein